MFCLWKSVYQKSEQKKIRKCVLLVFNAARGLLTNDCKGEGGELFQIDT